MRGHLARALLVALAACLGAAPAVARGQGPFVLPPIPGLDEFAAIPDDNRLTLAKIALGRHLFLDPMLSRDGTVSCASCHKPGYLFADTLPLSPGVDGRTGRRNAPSLVNRVYGASFFWDGRATTLESQVLQPIRDPLEMDLPLNELVSRLRGDPAYQLLFAAAFSDGIRTTNIARGLASFVRSIRSGDSPVDRYDLGDTLALSRDALLGMGLFNGKANCFACHSGAAFTDEKFHNTGVAVGTKDLGRFTVTGHPSDRHAFKTPSLRDVARTAPYMHNGSLATLEDVIAFYVRGGRPSATLDREIHPLTLSLAEQRELVAFLRALSGSVSAGLPLER